MVQLKSHFLDIALEGLEPVTLHYLTAGNPENPPLLCVHALTANAHDFDYLADRIADRFFVVAPDMPGRGDSSHLQDKTGYSNDNHLRWTLALLQHLHIRHVHWVGASMGGIMGMMACAIHPELVLSLMLNDVGAILAAEGLKNIVSYTKEPLPIDDNAAFEARLRKDAAPFAIKEETQWQHFFHSRVKRNEQGHYVLKRDAAVIEPLRQWVQNVAEPADISLDPFWQAVTCPVLLFHGEDSLLLRKDTSLAMQNASGKDVTVHHFTGVGHMPNLMEKAQLDIIENWLNARR